MHWLEQLGRIWPHLVAGLALFAALLASVHTLLHKRDSRAAVLWLGFIWLMPLLGASPSCQSEDVRFSAVYGRRCAAF